MEAILEQAPVTTETEPTNESVSNSLGIGEAPAPVANEPVQSQGFDETKLASLIEAQLKNFLNPIQSELGQFRKVRSEFEQFKNQKPQNVTQPPTSWAELNQDQQKATRDLVNHLIQDILGEKLGKYDKALEGFESQQSVQSVMGIAQNYAGADFEKLNPIAGKLFTEISKAAAEGNDSAAVFINEINTTQSGVMRLIDMARQEYAKSVDAQSSKAKAEQEAKAKRAGTALGATGQGGAPKTSLDNLPKDPKEKLKMLEQMMKEAGKL